MRNLLLIAVSIFTLAGCAPYQTITANDYPSPFEFSITDTATGTEAQLFVRANQWMAKTFNSAKAVIQMSDKEAGKLIGRAIFKVTLTNGFIQYNGIVNYTLSIDVKDGKFKCTISGMSHENDVTSQMKGGQSYGSLDQSTIPPIMGYNINKEWYSIKNQSMDYSKVLLEVFRKAMQTKDAEF